LSQSGSLAVNLAFVGKKPTGLATYATNIVPSLQESKWPRADLTLLTPASLLAGYADRFVCTEIPANLTPEQGKLGHLRRLGWTQFQLPQICQRLRSSLLFSPVPEAPLYSSCRFVVVVHDLIPLRFPRWTSPLTHYFRYYVPLVLQQAEHVICNSIATAQDIIEVYGIPSQKLTPIPLAHDAANFRVLDLSDQPAIDRPYFFYVGRHDPYKNLERVIGAFAQLSDTQAYELWIAGSADPRYTPLLRTQAHQLGLRDRVKFLDYVAYQELPSLLNRALALVYPSLWEGFGFPVLEAMACGTPVITSNFSSLPEVAGDAAILVDPYSEREIAAAMQQIATDSNGRAQMRSAGLARANQFSWAKTGQVTVELLSRYW
jgi:glycosyltransferase involved in cell wall biosynthesis